MSDPLQISGDTIARLFFGIQLVGLLVVVALVAFPPDSLLDVWIVVLATVFAALAAIWLWRHETGRTHIPVFGTSEDITYDPYVFPGQAAKERWVRAVRRLPDEDDEQD